MTSLVNQPQTIIHRKAGHQVPKELWETALRKCPTASGFAIRMTEDDKTTLETDKFDKTVGVENMLNLDTQSKEYDAVFYLANLPNKFTKDDVQPFILTIFEDENDKTGQDILSFFLEGDFPKYSDLKAGHTDEYNFAHEIIIPTLQDMFLAAGQDIAAFTASLHKPLFEKNMMAHVGHRAAFVFLPLEGEPIKFGINDLGAGWDWGTASQHLDFDKVTKPITSAVDKVVAGAKKFNPFSKGGAEPSKVDDKGIHHLSEKKEDPIDKVATSTMLGKTLVKPPKGLDKSGKNRWLRLFNNGQLPDKHDHRDFPGLWVTPDVLPWANKQDLTTLAQVDALGAEMRTGIKKQAVIPTEVKKTSPSDFLPSMTDQEMTDQTTILSKFIDREKVPSALDIQKIESQWPTYSEKMGIPFEDMFRWTVAEIMEVCKGHKPSVMIILEMRRRLIEKLDVKDLINTAAKEKAVHVEAKAILKPDGTPATASAKRNAIFGIKKSA